MREITVNARFLTRRVTGVERYGREILHHLPGPCRVERPEWLLGGWMGHAWEQLILPRRLEPNSVLWSPANTGPLLVREQVLTLHDLSALEHPEWFRNSFAAWYRLFLPMLARRVHRIIVPSEFVKRKVVQRFSLTSEKVVTIPAGVDTSKFRPVSVSNKTGRYMLFVGTLEPRKNLSSLLRAWKEVQKEFRDISLVVAGTAGRVFGQLSYPASMSGVHWAGYVPEEELPSLYSGAEALVLPSLEEGFGLTALEAMACGTPVIVSNGGALPEVVGDAALIYSLSDPAGLDRALRECLLNPGLRATLSEKGLARASRFSWQASAQSVWETLHES